MYVRRLLLAVAAAVGLWAASAPAASAQSIWGNGSPVSGVANNQTVLSVAGGNGTVRCRVTVTAAGLIGPVSSAPFNVSYTNCTFSVAGTVLPATVTATNPSTWSTAGATYNPLSGVWTNSTVTRPGNLVVTVPSLGCTITQPGPLTVITNGTNTGTPPSSWTGTSMNMTRTNIPWSQVGCPGLPVAAADGTIVIIIIVVNWWDP